MIDPLLVLGAAALEAAIGYPAALHTRVPHPVVWIGNLIGAAERGLNRSEWPARRRKIAGICTVIGIAMLVGAVGAAVARLGAIVLILAATLGLAQRSLHDHVAAVDRALKGGDLVAARDAVAQIVGRDTAALDESGVAAAALESLAESFNDGVIAPLFWLLVAGLPGLFIYKAINTADSMIGHMEPRWRDFGWAAARTDDVLNYVPARIAGALIALAAAGGWSTMLRDARKHASPNAGWPEAAMAGALHVQLGGPAAYDGVMHTRPTFGEGPAPRPGDLAIGLAVYRRACVSGWIVLLAGGALWHL
jgi:adenosylcobinamide-phosphate synthase